MNRDGMAVSGALERPEFGEPGQAHYYRRKPVPFPYGKLLDTVRAHPGQFAKIAVFNTVSRKHRQYQVVYARDKVKKWLEKNHPFEDWKLLVRTTPDTWGDKELWVCFVGIFDTAEEAMLARKKRKEEWREARARGQVRQLDRVARENMATIRNHNRRRP